MKKIGNILFEMYNGFKTAIDIVMRAFVSVIVYGIVLGVTKTDTNTPMMLTCIVWTAIPMVDYLIRTFRLHMRRRILKAWRGQEDKE